MLLPVRCFLNRHPVWFGSLRPPREVHLIITKYFYTITPTTYNYCHRPDLVYSHRKLLDLVIKRTCPTPQYTKRSIRYIQYIFMWLYQKRGISYPNERRDYRILWDIKTGKLWSEWTDLEKQKIEETPLFRRLQPLIPPKLKCEERSSPLDLWLLACTHPSLLLATAWRSGRRSWRRTDFTPPSRRSCTYNHPKHRRFCFLPSDTIL